MPRALSRSPRIELRSTLRRFKLLARFGRDGDHRGVEVGTARSSPQKTTDESIAGWNM
jgi:hypothetical protein